MVGNKSLSGSLSACKIYSLIRAGTYVHIPASPALHVASQYWSMHNIPMGRFFIQDVRHAEQRLDKLQVVYVYCFGLAAMPLPGMLWPLHACILPAPHSAVLYQLVHLHNREVVMCVRFARCLA
jgi:hypothetical protein